MPLSTEPIPHPSATDARGRAVNYMRLSVTDRCNLRCRYCVCEERPFIPHQDILRYEELMELMALAPRLGISKVRLTGGEPFARKDFAGFVEAALLTHPELDIRLTTNATLMAPHLPRLAAAGLKSVNISLDTLDPAKFKDITGRDFFGRVRAAIDAALAAGLRVKVNTVAARGVNDDELPAFLAFAAEHRVQWRFIELMPMGGCWGGDIWPAADILAEAGRLATLTPVARNAHSGPAEVFAIAGGLGEIGVISPVSNHFCNSCNRVRITSDGHLRTCLFSDVQYRLRPALRHPALGPDAVERIIRAALVHKPLGHELLAARKAARVCRSAMSSIGG